MRQSGITTLCAAAVLATAVSFLFSSAGRAPRALAASCTLDPTNLTVNGSMAGPGYSAAGYGIVANDWHAFVLSPVTPSFEWVSNENANGDVAGTGSQYIWADLDQFDAGIYQTVSGLTPGIYYRFWLGMALAAYDPGDQKNHRNSLIGRQVGIDFAGGTNPSAPSVVWGNVYWDGIAALNIPDLSMTFPAQTSRVTLFLRVVNTNTTGRSKVWFDVVCMQLLDPQPTLIPPPPTGPSTIYLPMITSNPISTSIDTITVSEGSVTLNAYPYDSFQLDALDPVYNVAYKRFDWTAYGQAPRTAAPKSYRKVVIANDYLELTFLPDLGGRLWQVEFKPTGQTILYNNQVVKPTHWGPPQQDGWLALGGMEWALPVDEHGYEWGIPWAYTITRTPGEATITFRDSLANDRPRAQVSVTLPAHAAYFTVRPRIENPTGSPVSLQFWVNAAIGLNTKNVSAATDFVLPAASVFVHSTGDSFIPAANVPPDGAVAPAPAVAWPVVAGRDLSRYENWDNYLGVFAAEPTRGLAGAYSHVSDLGVVRVFSVGAAPGLKLFAFGPNFSGRQEIADDGSDYFELWGGLPRTFFSDDSVSLSPGAAREWDEDWIPFAGTGGLTSATRAAVLVLEVDASQVATVAAAVTAPHTNGTLILSNGAQELARWHVTLDPGTPFKTSTAVGSAVDLRLQFVASDGSVLARAP